jgi:redox-sensitive bicupin YhaK (pirin superfamily)
MSQLRPISKLIQPQTVIEGAGVLLRRSFGPTRQNPLDPFLLFDHFAFNDPLEGTNPGFPMHPHRGIETVTYMLEGSVHHRDSLGNSGLIEAGDVQWMTSGGGILHEEMPRRSPQGNVYGFQLWVNLPAALKMSPPRYQEVRAGTIPLVYSDGASIRVVAGEVNGVRGPVTEIAADPVYLDVTLEPGAVFTYPIPANHTAIAYVFAGHGEFGQGESVDSVSLVVFGEGDAVHAEADTETELRFMLVAGAPFNEPAIPYGPFVMNTVEEIQQALADLRNGTFVR